MILAPVFAVLMIVVAVHAPDIVASLQAAPLVGPLFQKAISPKATGMLVMVGVLCPAIPALFAVALYRGLYQLARDWKAQRIRKRRKMDWLSRERVVAPTIERLAHRKSGIDNSGKSI